MCRGLDTTSPFEVRNAGVGGNRPRASDSMPADPCRQDGRGRLAAKLKLATLTSPVIEVQIQTVRRLAPRPEVSDIDARRGAGVISDHSRTCRVLTVCGMRVLRHFLVVVEVYRQNRRFDSIT